jgi:integrase
MARQINRLTDRRVRTVKKPGRHADGGGLYLVVDQSGANRWVFMSWRGGRQIEIGLGGLVSVSLAMARERAFECRASVAAGGNPIEARKAARSIPSFGDMADQLIAAMSPSWRNEKHRAQWVMTLQNYAAPLRGKRVDAITTEDVLAVLRPIWTAKSETASRLRGRIEKVLDAAKAKGHRSGENPARWRGHLDHLLPRRQKLTRAHHAAMPWSEVPAFVERLHVRPSVAGLACEFLIFTAARSGEILRSRREGKLQGMRWEEVDLKNEIWTVPAIRMKAGRPHRVPLSKRAIQILHEIEKLGSGEFVFPSQQRGKPLSEGAIVALLKRMKVENVTPHGFRSSFRDWAGECTNFSRETAEAALAHTVGDKVEQAYRRSDALEKRRELMEAWARFCGSNKASNVVQMRKTGTP